LEVLKGEVRNNRFPASYSGAGSAQAERKPRSGSRADLASATSSPLRLRSNFVPVHQKDRLPIIYFLPKRERRTDLPNLQHCALRISNGGCATSPVSDRRRSPPGPATATMVAGRPLLPAAAISEAIVVRPHRVLQMVSANTATVYNAQKNGSGPAISRSRA
jgi:hypothetical protein